MKKINGPMAESINVLTGLRHYERQCESGEIGTVIPEYSTMSLKPGIGADWFKKYKDDVFPDDFVVIEGKRVKTPRFYLTLLERMDTEEAAVIKKLRMRSLERHSEDNTPARLAVREKCQAARLKLLPRGLE